MTVVENRSTKCSHSMHLHLAPACSGRDPIIVSAGFKTRFSLRVCMSSIDILLEQYTYQLERKNPGMTIPSAVGFELGRFLDVWDANLAASFNWKGFSTEHPKSKLCHHEPSQKRLVREKSWRRACDEMPLLVLSVFHNEMTRCGKSTIHRKEWPWLLEIELVIYGSRAFFQLSLRIIPPKNHPSSGNECDPTLFSSWTSEKIQDLGET